MAEEAEEVMVVAKLVLGTPPQKGAWVHYVQSQTRWVVCQVVENKPPHWCRDPRQCSGRVDAHYCKRNRGGPLEYVGQQS